MERFIKKPHMVASLRRGPLALFLDDIAQELIDDGYSISTGKFQILVASDFSCWMERESLRPEVLRRMHATAYMRDRDERQCSCRQEAEAAINRLLEFLLRRGVICEEGSAPKTEIEQVIEVFGTYLSEQRDLAPRTVIGYKRFTLRFFAGHFT